MLFLTQCKSTHQGINKKYLSKTDQLNLLIESDSILSQHYMGLHFRSLKDGHEIYNLNSDKLFIPASNIKLLTYFTCLNILSDSIISFKYISTPDELRIVPNADPSFLNLELDTVQLGIELINEASKKIVVYNNPKNNYTHYGSGWAWDDNPYSFQTPLSYFPVYGNNVTFSNSSDKLIGINVTPRYFNKSIIKSEDNKSFISRANDDNVYTINYSKKPTEFKIKKPFLPTDQLIINLLSDTIASVIDIKKDSISSLGWTEVKSLPADSLYKIMLLKSDNFISEQLLLMCSNQQLGYMSSKDIIEFTLDSIMTLNQESIKWVDGSGLSRYNLVSPSTFVNVLENLYRKVPFDKLKKMLPSAKPSDSLPQMFKGNGDWIYAKTGTLSNTFCLSGYIITDRRNIIAFSFLNNHFTTQRKDVQQSIKKTLLFVKRNF